VRVLLVSPHDVRVLALKGVGIPATKELEFSTVAGGR
jgi:hypothetical protein